MRLEIIIEDVDDEAYTDIQYFINKYFLKIDGMKKINFGICTTGETGMQRNHYCIKRDTALTMKYGVIVE